MHNAGLTLAVALAAGVLAQSVSRLVRLPGIVLLLLTGAVLGPEGLSWIDPGTLGSGLFAVVDFGVAVVLFEGGLNLEWSRLRRQEAAIRRLITTGALVTLVGATLLAVAVLGWRWDVALLFGSLVGRDRSHGGGATTPGYAPAAEASDDPRSRGRVH